MTLFQRMRPRLLADNVRGEDSWRERTSDVLVRGLLVPWLLLLFPWLFLTFLAGMAFDSGDKVSATLLVLSAWSYGPAVFAAFTLLDRSRKAVLLSFISLSGILLSNFFMVNR